MGMTTRLPQKAHFWQKVRGASQLGIRSAMGIKKLPAHISIHIHCPLSRSLCSAEDAISSCLAPIPTIWAMEAEIPLMDQLRWAKLGNWFSARNGRRCKEKQKHWMCFSGNRKHLKRTGTGNLPSFSVKRFHLISWGVYFKTISVTLLNRDYALFQLIFTAF